MDAQEVFPLNAAPGSRFSVSVSNGNVLVVPLSQAAGAHLQQIPTHVLNEQVYMQINNY